jgi:hypothetical protein
VLNPSSAVNGSVLDAPEWATEALLNSHFTIGNAIDSTFEQARRDFFIIILEMHWSRPVRHTVLPLLARPSDARCQSHTVQSRVRRGGSRFLNRTGSTYVFQPRTASKNRQSRKIDKALRLHTTGFMALMFFSQPVRFHDPSSHPLAKHVPVA